MRRPWAFAVLLALPCSAAEKGRGVPSAPPVQILPAPLPIGAALPAPGALSAPPAGLEGARVPVLPPPIIVGDPAVRVLPSPIAVGAAAQAPAPELGAALAPEPPSSGGVPQEPAKTGFAARVGRALAWLKDPFGTARPAAEPAAPAAPAPSLETLSLGQTLRLPEKGGQDAVVLDLGFREVDHLILDQKGSSRRSRGYKKLAKAESRHILPKAEWEALARAQGLDPARVETAVRRRKELRRFEASDPWGALSGGLANEISALRSARLPKAEVRARLRAVADSVVRAIQAKHGSENLGFHFNLHGGQVEEYVDGGGIRATRGDIALQYGSGDPAEKVYFFQSKLHNLYDALDERHPQILIGSSRMGHVFMVFRLDHPSLVAGMKSGAVSKHTAISLDFDTGKLKGVPYEAFVAPPLEVFPPGLGKRLGLGRLSRDEETLAALRYIEAAALRP